jgi:PPOX class probable F420-dependent enzyme
MGLINDEAREVLSKPLIARLATVNEDGMPHVVPLWFLLENDEIFIISERDTQKVRNLIRHPRAAVTVGGDDLAAHGFMLQGTVSITEDVDNALTNRITRLYEPNEEGEKHILEWADFDMVIVRLTPTKVKKVI